MKRVFYIGFSIMTLYCLGTTFANTNGRGRNTPKNLITLNTIPAVFNRFPIFSYERVFNKKNSILFAYGRRFNYTLSGGKVEDTFYERNYGYNRSDIGRIEQDFYNTSYMNFEIRSYLSHRQRSAPRGFHIGPSLNFGTIHERFKVYTTTGDLKEEQTDGYKISSLNINIGSQLLINNKVPINLILGPGYSLVKRLDTPSPNNIGLKESGFIFQFALNVGIAFGN